MDLHGKLLKSLVSFRFQILTYTCVTSRVEISKCYLGGFETRRHIFDRIAVLKPSIFWIHSAGYLSYWDYYMDIT